jgi:2-dehydropantoate 2-reductase
MEKSTKVAVMGAGAVGCYFGGMLARSGVSVTLIGHSRNIEAIARHGLRFKSSTFEGSIPVAASTDPAAAAGASIILFCVKCYDTVSAAESLAPYISSDSIIISLQNGLGNLESIRSKTASPVVPAVVYVAANMIEAGIVQHTGGGTLIVGEPDEKKIVNRESPAGLFAQLMTGAGVPCRISENIEGDLWAKLMMNCAYNAISALGKSKYKRMLASSDVKELMQDVIKEVECVGKAAGITFPLNAVEATFKYGVLSPEATSSTAQDILLGKRTEIDYLNGYICRRAAEFGIAVPVNRTITTLIKLLESTNPGPASGGE